MGGVVRSIWGDLHIRVCAYVVGQGHSVILLLSIGKDCSVGLNKILRIVFRRTRGSSLHQPCDVDRPREYIY